jgi:hypothetical protein
MNCKNSEGYEETTEESYQRTEDFIKKIQNMKVRSFLL